MRIKPGLKVKAHSFGKRIVGYVVRVDEKGKFVVVYCGKYESECVPIENVEVLE